MTLIFNPISTHAEVFYEIQLQTLQLFPDVSQFLQINWKLLHFYFLADGFNLYWIFIWEIFHWILKFHF